MYLYSIGSGEQDSIIPGLFIFPNQKTSLNKQIHSVPVNAHAFTVHVICQAFRPI